MRTYSRFQKSLLIEEYQKEGLPSPVQGNLKIHHAMEKMDQRVINLSIMTDQTPPPEVRIAAAEQALKGGYIKNALFLRKKICDYYQNKLGATFNPQNEIFLTTGSQLALDCTFKLLIEPGDEVLMGEPEYATYEPMIHFYDGKAIFCPLVLKDGKWAFNAEAFATAVTPKTKLIILSNPNNPVGYVYRREDLEAIAHIAKERNCWVMSDEIWSTLIIDEDTPFTTMGVFEEIKGKLVVLFSASKTFGMSGYRTGAIMGPTDFIEAVDQVVRFSVQTAPTIGQVAFNRALDWEVTGPWLEKRKAEIRGRIKDVVGRLNNLPDVHCAKPESGVFLFPDISALGLSSLDFALRLLEETAVYMLPGYFYGRHCDSYLRISLSVSEADLQEGINRFISFAKKLSS